MRTIIFEGPQPWEYYLITPFFGKAEKVTEEMFFAIVGHDRRETPMRYEPGNVNRQNFYAGDTDTLLGYRVRQR